VDCSSGRQITPYTWRRRQLDGRLAEALFVYVEIKQRGVISDDRSKPSGRSAAVLSV
jgi:hypothetical protein